MFEKSRTVSHVTCFFTSTSKVDDDVIRNTVDGVYADHRHLKRTSGASMPSVEKMAAKVLGNLLYKQDCPGLARVKQEYLPVAIRAYGECVREIDSRPGWG